MKLLFSKNLMVKEVIQEGIKYGSAKICIFQKSKFSLDENDNTKMLWDLGFDARKSTISDIRDLIEILKANNITYSFKKSNDNCIDESRVYLIVDPQ